jgi:Xaa-Pro aminopeptidase
VLASLKSLEPGQTQRTAEAIVVATCLATGADGVAWWPWVMTGPNAAFPTTFESFGDYRHINRTMQAGELARIDIGCETDHYTSDVGRTAPVSGVWENGQREAWDLLVDAYLAGLAIVREGIAPFEIREAFQAEVRTRRASLQTDLGRKAADLLLTDDGMRYWQVHHVGIDPSEGADLGAPLRAGMVVAYEPIFTVEGQGFYLEDLLLITDDGYELLTDGLPYTSDEIERAMR